MKELEKVQDKQFISSTDVVQLAAQCSEQISELFVNNQTITRGQLLRGEKPTDNPQDIHPEQG